MENNERIIPPGYMELSLGKIIKPGYKYIDTPKETKWQTPGFSFAGQRFTSNLAYKIIVPILNETTK